jgi:cytochrome c553
VAGAPNAALVHVSFSTQTAVALALTLAGCESAPQGTPQPVSRPHFAAAAELQHAVVHGRLVAARDAAHAVAREANTTDQPSSHVVEVRDAAARIAAADDLDSAAARLGGLGHACGRCHESSGADVTFAAIPAPADDTTLPSHELRATWAAARLWEGLVGPDASSWQAGTRELATMRIDLTGAIHEKPNVEVFEFAESLRERAGEGLERSAPDARLHGEMLRACVGCHDITRLQPTARR